MDYKVILQFLNRPFGIYNIRGIYVEPTYWMAGTIFLLAFLLLLTLARLRYLYVHWSLNRSAISFLFYGFLLALIIEGFFILSGRTIFTEVLGWENAPKPVSTLLDVARSRVAKVLGVTEQIPESVAREKPSYQNVVSDYQTLSPEEAEKVRSSICEFQTQ